MAFWLYRFDTSANCFCRDTELTGRYTLWGKNGAVAECAEPKVSRLGPWRVTEEELLRQLLPRIYTSGTLDPTGFAIVDDLVPGGPEIRVARIKEVRGYLTEVRMAEGRTERYNPILFVMDELLYLDPADLLEAEKEELKRCIVFSPEPRVIRSINYLIHGWRPPRRFGGALLWPDHWEYLTKR